MSGDFQPFLVIKNSTPQAIINRHKGLNTFFPFPMRSAWAEGCGRAADFVIYKGIFYLCACAVTELVAVEELSILLFIREFFTCAHACSAWADGGGRVVDFVIYTGIFYLCACALCSTWASGGGRVADFGVYKGIFTCAHVHKLKFKSNFLIYSTRQLTLCPPF